MAGTDVADKWDLMVAEGGFTQVPTYLLYLNQFADPDERLSPVELVTLIQLVSVWWKKDDPPYPSIKTIATRSGVSERQIHRSLNELERKNLIKRMKKKGKGIISTNAYDLMPLVETLQEAAKLHETPYKRTIKTSSKIKKISTTTPSGGKTM